MPVEVTTRVGEVPAARLGVAARLLTAVVPAPCTGLTPYDSERFAHYLTAAAQVPPRSRTLLVRGCARDGELVAVADWRLLDSVLFLNGIAVAPDARGRGYARELLDDGLSLARAHQCQSIELDVAADNLVAHQWYERSGFEHVGAMTWEEVQLDKAGAGEPDVGNQCRVRNWPAFDSHHARYGFGDLEVSGPVGELTVRVLPGGWRVPRASCATSVVDALAGLLLAPTRIYVVTDGDEPPEREQTRPLMSYYRMRLPVRAAVMFDG